MVEYELKKKTRHRKCCEMSAIFFLIFFNFLFLQHYFIDVVFLMSSADFSAETIPHITHAKT